MKYTPETYWENRLEEYKGTLEGVGQSGRSPLWNQKLYELRALAMERALDKVDLDLSESLLLDIGTGIGFWIDFFISKNIKGALGLDISSSTIGDLKRRFASRKGQLNFINQDITQKDVNLKRLFDIVTAIDVFYHITDKERFETGLKNICRHMKKGSYIIFTDILHEGQGQFSTEAHVAWHSKKVYADIFAEHGIHIKYIAPMFITLHPPIDNSNKYSKILHIPHYYLTYPLTRNPPRFPKIERAYLSVLKNIDVNFSRNVKLGVGMKIAVAKKEV